MRSERRQMIESAQKWPAAANPIESANPKWSPFSQSASALSRTKLVKIRSNFSERINIRRVFHHTTKMTEKTHIFRTGMDTSHLLAAE